MGVGVETAERAAVEDERLAARALERRDLADHEVVVAGAHDVGHLAAQQRERVAHREVAEAVLHRVAGRGIGAALGEVERDLLLAPVQDVDGEALAGDRLLERARAVRERDEHEQRLERDRRERVERHPRRMAVVLARDHADAGGESPDDLTELAIDARHRAKHARLRTRAVPCKTGVLTLTRSRARASRRRRTGGTAWRPGASAWQPPSLARSRINRDVL